jgi:hypothetical protein
MQVEPLTCRPTCSFANQGSREYPRLSETMGTNGDQGKVGGRGRTSPGPPLTRTTVPREEILRVVRSRRPTLHPLELALHEDHQGLGWEPGGRMFAWLQWSVMRLKGPSSTRGQRVTVNMFEVPSSEALLENNTSVNTIYASNDLDEEQDFLSVIDAIQGEGFNPLWHQVLIVFNEGFTPHQFVSEDQVLAAASGANPEITLVSTDEVYRCSIVGSK